MQAEKPESSPPRPTKKKASLPPRPTTNPGALKGSALPPRPATTPGVAPPPPASPPAPAVADSGSMPPPPPSARPRDQRPAALDVSPLPPPVSQKPRLPKAPPVTKVGAQQNTDELKRLEEENHSLRKRLSTQREETRVEQKNVERLRAELASFKNNQATVTPSPAPASERAPVDQLRAEHLEELRDVKTKHQKEIGELKSAHHRELNQLKNQHTIELRHKGEAAKVHEEESLTGASDELEELKRQLADLKEKTTAFRLKNTELREKNGALENEVRQLKSTLTAFPTTRSDTPLAASSVGMGDDLTELKGVGPKSAKALYAAGVTSFHQIASWTEADIEAIAPKIKMKADRIRKNNWVEEAKKRTH